MVSRRLGRLKRQAVQLHGLVHQLTFQRQPLGDRILDVGLLQPGLLDGNVARQARELVVVLAPGIGQLAGQHPGRQRKAQRLGCAHHLLLARQRHLGFAVARSIPDGLLCFGLQAGTALNAGRDHGLQVVQQARCIARRALELKGRGLQQLQLGHVVQLVQPILVQIHAAKLVGGQRQKVRRIGNGHLPHLGQGRGLADHQFRRGAEVHGRRLQLKAG